MHIERLLTRDAYTIEAKGTLTTFFHHSNNHVAGTIGDVYGVATLISLEDSTRRFCYVLRQLACFGNGSSRAPSFAPLTAFPVAPPPSRMFMQRAK